MSPPLQKEVWATPCGAPGVWLWPQIIAINFLNLQLQATYTKINRCLSDLWIYRLGISQLPPLPPPPRKNGGSLRLHFSEITISPIRSKLLSPSKFPRAGKLH